MRILFVNKFLYPRGGAETYCFELSRELIARGHEVQFFGMRDERNVVGNDAGLYAKSADFHTAGPEKLLYPFRILYSADAKRKVLRLIDAFRPDVAHVNNISFHLTPSVLEAFRERGVPVVMTAHDYQLVCPNHMLYVPATGTLCTDCTRKPDPVCIRRGCIHGSALRSALGYLEAQLYRRRDSYDAVDVILCPSLFMREMLSRQPRFADRTVFLRNYCRSFDGGAAAERGDYVLFFGRLSVEKGVENLLEAAGRLSGVPIVIAGDGPLRGAVERCGAVRYVGFKSGAELEALIRGARFSVCPSVWYENCPLSILESQRLGTPCLATGIGGMKELVGESCRIPEPTADALVKAVRAMYDSDEALKKASDELPERVRSYPSLSGYADRLEELYAGAIRARRA
jgi:glycosyltransferase involved in cell wall biosynthesis